MAARPIVASLERAEASINRKKAKEAQEAQNAYPSYGATALAALAEMEAKSMQARDSDSRDNNATSPSQPIQKPFKGRSRLRSPNFRIRSSPSTSISSHTTNRRPSNAAAQQRTHDAAQVVAGILMQVPGRGREQPLLDGASERHGVDCSCDECEGSKQRYCVRVWLIVISTMVTLGLIGVAVVHFTKN